MSLLFYFINLLAQVLTFAIFIRAILSWFPVDSKNPLVVTLHQITDPILTPIRRIVPTIGMIDIAPLVAIILLQIIVSATARLA